MHHLRRTSVWRRCPAVVRVFHAVFYVALCLRVHSLRALPNCERPLTCEMTSWQATKSVNPKLRLELFTITENSTDTKQQVKRKVLACPKAKGWKALSACACAYFSNWSLKSSKTICKSADATEKNPKTFNTVNICFAWNCFKLEKTMIFLNAEMKLLCSIV